jgi:hypothetical protein
MATFLIAFVLFAIVIAGMAVGVIFSNKPIKGSCGGLSNIGIGGDCEICGGNLDKCEESKEQPRKVTDLSYDASKR